MTRFLLTMLCLLCFCSLNYAQSLPSANAVQTALTLSFTQNVLNPTSVAYHPDYQNYYIVRAGNANFPLETKNLQGNHLFSTTAGVDTRGLWWNANTHSIEKNCYNNIGWRASQMDNIGNMLSTNLLILNGTFQPNTQSVGAFDYQHNEVIFNHLGIISRYNRNTGAFISAYPLVGINVSNLNWNTVIYTDVTHCEIGIYDFVNKKVLFFERNTGTLTATSQLPPNAPANAAYRFSYANQLIWLFDYGNQVWKSYNVWLTPLPINDLTLQAAQIAPHTAHITWQSPKPDNDWLKYHLQRSTDGIHFENIYAADIQATDFTYNDLRLSENTYYYRVQVLKNNGEELFSEMQKITLQNPENEPITIFPNPAATTFTLQYYAKNEEMATLWTVTGEKVMQVFLETSGTTQINVSHLARGVYFVKIGKQSQKLVIE